MVGRIGVVKRHRRGLSASKFRKIKERQAYRCIYCNRYCHLQKEHLIPVSRGGTNDDENIVGACSFCNTRKGFLLPLEFVFGVPRSAIKARPA